MKNFRKVFALVVSVSILSVMLLSGCGEDAPEHDHSLYLHQGIYNLFGTESFRYAVGVDMVMPQASLPSASDGDAMVDFSMNGALSSKDSDESGGEMTVVVKISGLEESDYRFDLSLKSLEKYLYVKLLSVPQIPNFPVELIEGLVGTWWQLESDVTDDVAFNMETFGGFGKNESMITDLEKAERDLLAGAELFSEVEFIGTESVNHDDAYGYHVISDRQGIEEFVTKVSELRGGTLEDMENSGLLGFIYYGKMDFEGDLFVDIATSTLVELSGFATLTDPDTGEVTELELEISFSDLDQPFHIEEPVDYEVFDLGAFFGGFFGEDMGVEMSEDPSVDLVVEPVVEPEVLE